MDITKIKSTGYNITYIAQPGEHGPRVLVDWRSPFNREATAAIRSSFTEAGQWETIKEWGRANQALTTAYSPYIAEDPRIMCSLVSGLGIDRWLRCLNKAYIDTGIYGTNNTHSSIYVSCGSGSPYYYFGNLSSWLSQGHGGGLRIGGGNIYYGNTYQSLNVIEDSAFHLVELDKNVVKVDGVTKHTFSPQTFTGSYTLTIGALRFSGSSMDGGEEAKIASYVIEQNGVAVREMYPFIRNGVNGMIDVLSGTFYQNAGTGSFTIEEV